MRERPASSNNNLQDIATTENSRGSFRWLCGSDDSRKKQLGIAIGIASLLLMVVGIAYLVVALTMKRTACNNTMPPIATDTLNKDFSMILTACECDAQDYQQFGSVTCAGTWRSAVSVASGTEAAMSGQRTNFALEDRRDLKEPLAICVWTHDDDRDVGAQILSVERLSIEVSRANGEDSLAAIEAASRPLRIHYYSPIDDGVVDIFSRIYYRTRTRRALVLLDLSRHPSLSEEEAIAAATNENYWWKIVVTGITARVQGTVPAAAIELREQESIVPEPTKPVVRRKLRGVRSANLLEEAPTAVVTDTDGDTPVATEESSAAPGYTDETPLAAESPAVTSSGITVKMGFLLALGVISYVLLMTFVILFCCFDGGAMIDVYYEWTMTGVTQSWKTAVTCVAKFFCCCCCPPSAAAKPSPAGAGDDGTAADDSYVSATATCGDGTSQCLSDLSSSSHHCDPAMLSGRDQEKPELPADDEAESSTTAPRSRVCVHNDE